MKTIKEVYRESLDKFKQEVETIVLNNFEENQGIHTVIFGLILDRDHMKIAILEGLGEMFADSDNKQQIAEIIKEAGKELKFIALALASEAGIAKAPLEKGSIVDANGNLREGILMGDTDTKDVLMIHYETFDETAMMTWEIIEEDDKPTLVPYIHEPWILKSEMKAHGIFANLIENNYSELATVLENQLKNNLN